MSNQHILPSEAKVMVSLLNQIRSSDTLTGLYDEHFQKSQLKRIVGELERRIEAIEELNYTCGTTLMVYVSDVHLQLIAGFIKLHKQKQKKGK